MATAAATGGIAADRPLIRGARLLTWAILGLAVVVGGTGYLAMRGKRWNFDLPVGAIHSEGGYAYRLELPNWLRDGLVEAPADGPQGELSDLVVLEDGRYLGPTHSTEDEVRQKGRGALRHSQGTIVFSASDNTDVRTNGREYKFRTTVRLGAPYRPAVRRVIEIALVLTFSAVAVLGLLDSSRRWSTALVLTALAAAGLSIFASGIPFVALAGLSAACGVVGLIWATASFLPRRARAVVEDRLPTVALVTASLGIGLVLIEGGLRVLESAAIKLPSWQAPPLVRPPQNEPPPQDLAEAGEESFRSLPAAVRERILARRRLLTLPDSWQMRETFVPGTRRAYYWHDVLHVHDTDLLRRSTPIPPRDRAKFRVMVIGDSLTYGFGVEESFTYPHALERKLNERYAAEVLNFGIPGYQSEDIAMVLEKFYDRIQPDLVIYGICHNDFLNSGEGQSQEIAFPKFLTDRAKVASVLENGTRAAARSLGLRPDFFEQVLGNIAVYEPRFSRDLRRMNDFVLQKGGRPVMAMVLDQFPVTGDRGQRITALAEEAAQRAGMDVIRTADYYQAYHRQVLSVSAWEGHPNEWAHQIFAAMIYRHVVESGCCGLERFRLDSAKAK